MSFQNLRLPNSKTKVNSWKLCARLEIENLDLRSEEESCDSDTSFQAADVESTFQDIIGHRKYSPEIRKLYYTLLADQVPVSKITDYSNSFEMLQSFYECGRTKTA